ncbi:MAG: acyl-ACP--UDP-N-acetylglucosamine O-acyltransferase [Pseudomonadota bacterium]|nr:acyl-ACP--UDP-N-acetylglucosamine O-acyltransferase [Pseudomonadota bacterium]
MIDSRAVIHPDARIAQDVTIGPYSVIGPDVEIDSGTWIGPHVVIQGITKIGRGNRIFQFASIGDAPQDKKYADEPTRLEIGDNNTIRECVTINRGTAQDEGLTRVGSGNWIMAYVHIAHDCILGNDIIMANNASLAGHVNIHDHAILGGFAMVHQFCKIGSYSFLQFAAGVNRDVPPCVVASGHPARPSGLNVEGLRRHGFSSEAITILKRAYRLLYRSGLRLEEARQELAGLAEDHASVQLFVDFLASNPRSIIR